MDQLHAGARLALLFLCPAFHKDNSDMSKRHFCHGLDVPHSTIENQGIRVAGHVFEINEPFVSIFLFFLSSQEFAVQNLAYVLDQLS